MPDYRPATPLSNPYKFSAYQTESSSLTGGADSKVTFDTELYDTSNNYDAVTNSRFTAPVTGYYHFDAVVSVAAPTSGAIYNAQLRKNGTLFSIGTEFTAPSTATVHYSVSDTLLLTAGDYVEVWAFNNGAVKSTNAGSTFRTRYSGYMVSRT